MLVYLIKNLCQKLQQKLELNTGQLEKTQGDLGNVKPIPLTLAGIRINEAKEMVLGYNQQTILYLNSGSPSKTFVLITR
jgi:hypothetical protein